MYKIICRIKGIAPLLINSPTERALRSIEDGIGGGRQSGEERAKEAYEKLHRTEDGECAITAEMIKGCLLGGSSMANLKVGRRALSQFLKATVFIDPPKISLGKKEPDVIDKRWGRIPPGPRGNAVIIYRPAFKEGWEAEFTFVVSDSRREATQIKQAFDEGGLLVGIGSGRPDYGRFKITKWEVIDGTK